MACTQLRPTRATARGCRVLGQPNVRARTRAGRVVTRASSTPVTKVEKFPLWSGIYRYLLDKQLGSLSPQDINALDKEQWQIVDVRPGPLFEKAHIEGAVNVPLYQPLDYSKPSPATFLRAAVYMINGVTPIEINPTFSEQMAEVAKGGKGLVFYCEAGGTLKPSVNFPDGKSSRSLQSCFRTLREGITDRVAHLDGGIYAWYNAGLPIAGKYDTSDVGRTPNAAS